MLKTPLPLKLILVAVGSLTTIGTVLLIAWSVEAVSTKTLTNEIGQSMAVLADQVKDKIDSALVERSLDLSRIASRLDDLNGDDARASQDILDQSLAEHPDFAWLGLVQLNRTVIAATDTSQRAAHSGFAPGVAKLALDQNPAKPTLRLLPPRDRTAGASADESWQIELSVPVLDHAGKLSAVAVAFVSWDWANTMAATLKQRPLVRGGAELIILANDGRAMLGPTLIRKSAADTEAFVKALTGGAGWLIDSVLGSGPSVTGFSRSGTDRIFGGDGWTVVVTQPTAIALAPLHQLQKTIYTFALIFAIHAILFHGFLASALASPFLKIAHAADEIRQSGDAVIPHLTNFAEAKTLSESLISLVGELKKRQASLVELGLTLEGQVRDRTQDLEDQNNLLVEATRIAERAIEAKSRLLAVASHDLRQPLYALNLYCLALKRRVFTQDAASLVVQFEQSLSSLNYMLDELLDVARLDAGLVSRTLGPVNLSEVIERIGSEFSYEADQRGLKFNFTSTRCYVLTDLAIFETILRNFLSNAFKFTSSGGIILAARSRGAMAVVEVYDTGPGIAPSRLASVFNEFERSRDQAHGPNEGLGLGLSIVDRHAKLIDAVVSVRSVVGRGSRFSVTLKKTEADDGMLVAPALKASALPITAIKVMLLDDDHKVLDALRLELSDRGASVSAFKTVQEAASALEAGLVVDVAVVDYDLGIDLTGIDFVREWRSKGAKFGALILTGRTDARTLSRIRESGVPWMTKPANSDALAAAIDRLSAPAAGAPHEANLYDKAMQSCQ